MIAKTFYSHDGLWVEAKCDEITGGHTERILTGGIHDIGRTTPRGVLVQIRSASTADPKKLTEVAREFLTRRLGRLPLAMEPTVSGWIDFRIEGVTVPDLNDLLYGLGIAFSLSEIEKAKQGPASKTLTLAEELSVHGRSRENLGKPAFTQVEVMKLFGEVEEDYGKFIQQLTGSGFKRDETKREVRLFAEWDTRYAGEETQKMKVVVLEIVARRIRKRIEEQREVKPGALGQLFGQQSRTVNDVRIEWPNEYETLRVSLISAFLMDRLGKKELGRDFVTGGTVDYVASVPDLRRTENRNLLIDESVTPSTLRASPKNQYFSPI